MNRYAPLVEHVGYKIGEAGCSLDHFCNEKLEEIQSELERGRISVETSLQEVHDVLRSCSCYLKPYHYNEIRKAIRQ